MPFLIALIVLAVLLLVASRRPDTFRVERSTVINAPAATVFGHVADFRRWIAWSPWEQLDPAMQRTYSGAESGVGAVYEWSGNRKAGQGWMEITKADSGSAVHLKLDFIKPFPASNISEFTLTPSGTGTAVNWAMHGPSNLMSKLMGVFFSMEKFIGRDFEKGLTSLKSVSEG